MFTKLSYKICIFNEVRYLPCNTKIIKTFEQKDTAQKNNNSTLGKRKRKKKLAYSLNFPQNLRMIATNNSTRTFLF